MNESVISATDLSLTFETNDGPVHALQDINLDIDTINLSQPLTLNNDPILDDVEVL